MDVIFLSHSESNAEENWLHLLRLAPKAQRVHGISGVFEAHQCAARLGKTEFIFIVDGDNYVFPEFCFYYPQDNLDEEALYVWRAKNPVNDLVYGFGGVKLYPRKLLLRNQNNFESADLATNISKKYVVVNELASETRFNSSPLEAWRGAFREGAKLKLKLARGLGDQESQERLSVWLTRGSDRLNGKWATKGAEEGCKFVEEVLTGRESELKLNDYTWLNNRFTVTKCSAGPVD